MMHYGRIIISIIIAWFLFAFLFAVLKKKSGKGSKLRTHEIILALILSVPLVFILVAVHLIQ